MTKPKGTFSRLHPAFRESIVAVLPILLIVMGLGFFIAPVPASTLLCFLFGAILLIIGMMFFNVGADLSLSRIGMHVGGTVTKRKKVWLLLGIGLVLGVIITVAEPDLQVLASQVPAVPNPALILSVAIGVGAFLLLAILRMLFQISFVHILIIAYVICFLLTAAVPPDFLAVAFDSGGVTTGPMTVPFIMAFGVGICQNRSDSRAEDDSFGLVALCSIGPILAVMLLGIIFGADGSDYVSPQIPYVEDSVEMARLFGKAFPDYIKEIALSLLPIAVFFGAFQVFPTRITGEDLKRVLLGLAYSYLGLVLFLTGVNVGFLPTGFYLGNVLALGPGNRILIPISMLIGYFVVKAEPAVYVLNRQVEEITGGAISARLMGTSLSIGVAVSMGLSMIRVLTGISLLWFLIPGYVIAMGISFFVPRIYTAIAFDSGGVASGPMTTAFVLPFAQGACMALGGNVVTDAFGIVAMVAMTPLITIQILGLFSVLSQKKASEVHEAGPVSADLSGADLIIEL